MNCKNCHWALPETCRACRAEELDQKIHRVVGELVKTRQVDLEPMETDPNWWKLHLLFRKN